MNYIGTSGWSYPSFLDFYGEKRSSLEQLAFYAKKLNTVEINYTFYHFPKIETFEKWNDATPEDFRFTLKLHKQFTHIDRLELSDASMEKLKDSLQKSQVLGTKLAVLLIQTPKSLKCDLERLEAFLKKISECLEDFPHKPRLAFEFRNVDWFTEGTYSLLSRHQAILVIAQSKQYPEHRVVTTDTLYLRFHGPEALFNSSYTQEELQEWGAFKESVENLQDVFAYFNNTMSGQAVENALYFQKILGEK